MAIRHVIGCDRCDRTFTSDREAEEHTLSHGDPRDVANYIHRKTCTANHIDGCSYEYDSWDSPGSTRLRYLDRARKVLELSREHGIDLRELLEVLA